MDYEKMTCNELKDHIAYLEDILATKKETEKCLEWNKVRDVLNEYIDHWGNIPIRMTNIYDFETDDCIDVVAYLSASELKNFEIKIEDAEID